MGGPAATVVFGAAMHGRGLTGAGYVDDLATLVEPGGIPQGEEDTTGRPGALLR